MHNLKRLKKLELEKDAPYIIFSPSLKARNKEIITIRLEIIQKGILKNRIKAKKAKV